MGKDNVDNTIAAFVKFTEKVKSSIHLDDCCVRYDFFLSFIQDRP